MRRKFALAAIATSLFADSANAQVVYQWVMPPSHEAPGTQHLYLQAGTPVLLRTTTEITSKQNTYGERIYLEVAQNVSYHGQTLIPAGTPVLAEISNVDPNGWFGKKGSVGIRLIETVTPWGPVRLGGRAEKAGHNQKLLSWGTFLFISWPGMFIHGTSASIKSGTAVEAVMLDDLHFTYYPNARDLQLGDSKPVSPDMSVLPKAG